MRRLLLFVALVALTSLAWAEDDRADAVERMNKAAEVMTQIMAAPDKGIPEEILDGAKCVAIVPDMFKAGFVFGGKHGKGVATCRTRAGWSAPAFFTISGGSWGAQIGAQSIDLIMMIMNEQGMKNMLANKFEIGADASAAAGPVGRHASAGTDWTLETQILTYSRTKGLFAGVMLKGDVIRADDDSMRAMYNAKATHSAALTGKLTAPAAARKFLTTVAKAKNIAETKSQ
jgi:lipid-binding SYLF domain-containing protein